MPDDPVPIVVTDSCLYECNGENYVLVGGTAPEGYYCPEVLSSCNAAGEGDTASGAPKLIEVDGAAQSIVEAQSDLRAAGTASYRYEPETNTCYFSEGALAPAKSNYIGKIILTELKKILPEIASAVEAKKAANPGMGFSIDIPSVRKELL